MTIKAPSAGNRQSLFHQKKEAAAHEAQQLPPPNSRPGGPEIPEISLSHFLGGSTRASRESFRDHGLYRIKRKRRVHPYKKMRNSFDFF